jgi:hypothetical protein
MWDVSHRSGLLVTLRGRCSGLDVDNEGRPPPCLSVDDASFRDLTPIQFPPLNSTQPDPCDQTSSLSYRGLSRACLINGVHVPV